MGVCWEMRLHTVIGRFVSLVRDTLSSLAPAGFFYEIGFLIRLSVLRNLIQAIPNMAVASDQWRGHFSSPNCS
jgi:hypothetical protein